MSNGSLNGVPRWKPRCRQCHKAAFPLWRAGSGERGKRGRYRRYKLGVCNRCGFVPEDPCQLDVDHIDGNRSNDAPDNLQTLCANCHRLKTKQSGDGFYRV